MSNFAAALQAHLESLPHLGIMEKRALRIASNPDAPHNARVLARWEPASAEAVGISPEMNHTCPCGYPHLPHDSCDGTPQSPVIDWFKAHWVQILQVILMLLPFFLAKPPQEMHAAMMASPEFDAASDWWLGKNALLAIIPSIIDHLGLAWIRTLIGKSPIPIAYQDADMRGLLLRTLQESQT